MVIHVKRAGYLPPWGWQLCRVMGGSFRVKWVAALPCNQWQLCREIRRYVTVGDNTLADALLDRLIHNAHRLALKGESMRKKMVKLTEREHLS